jgi:putative sporulation protein YyaC
MNLKRGFFEGKKKERISYEDHLAAENLATELISYFPAIKSRPIVFVCIGTDRSTGDSLGPLTGTLLLEKNISSFFIYGTLDDPIHAVNLAEKLQEIHQKHFHPFIIGIDACLGRVKNVGMIEIGDGPVQPGAGVNKELPEVGSIHITGIVNVSGFMEFFVLQNTRLNLVLKMAKTIANGIYKASILYSLKSERSEYQSPISKEKLN